MKYRLWDTDIGKLLAVYETEEEALSLARMLIGTYGETSADDLTLSTEYDDGTYGEPVSGIALVDRANGAAAQRQDAKDRTGQIIGFPNRGGTSRTSGFSKTMAAAAAMNRPKEAIQRAYNAVRKDRAGRSAPASGQVRVKRP